MLGRARTARPHDGRRPPCRTVPRVSTPSLPDTPRVGVVVTDTYPAEDLDHDTPLLVAALRAAGVAAEAVVWHDPEVAWQDLDVALLRSPWDYPDRMPELLAWLDRVEAATTVLNPPGLVRWNIDKHYLAELADLGVAVVPTTYAADVDAARQDLASRPAGDRVVIKPAVSAGARDTGLFRADDPAALALATRVVAAGNVAMVQPEVPELSAGQEKALYLVDGTLTHAIAKGALLAPGGGLVGGVYQEHPVPVEVTPDEERFAAQVLAAVQRATGCEVPLYARVDLVRSAAHGIVLLEAELFEPALNLHVAPQATDAVVAAILGHLSRRSTTSR